MSLCEIVCDFFFCHIIDFFPPFLKIHFINICVYRLLEIYVYSSWFEIYIFFKYVTLLNITQIWNSKKT